MAIIKEKFSLNGKTLKNAILGISWPTLFILLLLIVCVAKKFVIASGLLTTFEEGILDAMVVAVIALLIIPRIKRFIA